MQYIKKNRNEGWLADCRRIRTGKKRRRENE